MVVGGVFRLGCEAKSASEYALITRSPCPASVPQPQNALLRCNITGFVAGLGGTALAKCFPTNTNIRLTDMASKGFWQAGHAPTLLAAFLYFDLAFMVWVILGPLGVQIATDLKLDAAQKGLRWPYRCSPVRCCGS